MFDFSKIGLDGSFQIHRAPLLLVIDERAHQVLVGFEESEFESAKCTVISRFGEDRNVWVLVDGEWVRETLGQWKSGQTVAISGVPGVHPGGFGGLVWVVDRLLGPGGCPWDIEQTHFTLRKYLLEESYELIEAIENEDLVAMKEELGDVLLQPLMHSQIRQRDGDWGIEDVAAGITEKLIRRHPHVFGNLSVQDSDEVLKNWDAIKRQEKGSEPQSTLSGIPSAMPALLKAMEVSKRAARCGFEWPDIESVWEKFDEEAAEVREALLGTDQLAIRDEIGDLLFTVVNLARWAKVDAEEALRTMVDRFRERFMYMESISTSPLQDLNADEWDQLWEQAKSIVKNS